MKSNLRSRRCRKAWQRGGRAWALLMLSFLGGSRAQTKTSVSPVDPLPQDQGALGLKQMLVRLHTTARLMQTTAHPDDEDGGMLTLESRGKGATVLLMTLTRGEGGQNKIGSNLFDVLGVVRTLELTQSDRYYGVEQRFSRVADFGYSKNPDETFRKWQGHEVALADMVRVIRQFRPDVLAARFSGTDRDGHGHHQASSILTQEAFRAAADPQRFPEQIQEGLLPWQAKKVYIGNVCGFGVSSCAAENYTLKLNTGVRSQALGESYVQFAMDGLRHQLSQGAANWTVDDGDRFTFYKLVDSVVNSPKDAEGHERDFFDGIDTTLPGLATRLGNEEAKAPWLKPALEKIAGRIDEATAAANKNPENAAAPLFATVDGLQDVIVRVEKADLSAGAKSDLLLNLQEKIEQARTAANLAMGVTVAATVAGDTNMVSPGQRLTVKVTFHNGARQAVTVQEVALEGFAGWDHELTQHKHEILPPGQDATAEFQFQIPREVKYTRPYWHRSDPEAEAINTIDDSRSVTLPFPPSPFAAQVRYAVQNVGAGAIAATVMGTFREENGQVSKRAMAVVPAFSVMLNPGEQVIPLDNRAPRAVTVEVNSNAVTSTKGALRLELPSGWKSEPAELAIDLPRRGESRRFDFEVLPANLSEGRAEIRAILNAAGERYSEGYSVVTREDLDSFYYYQPALQRVSVVDVRVPANLKVGYIMGAGDEIPTVLKQIGVDVTAIAPESLGTADLSRYQTIVLGIRAYDTQKSVATNNKRLLEFVSAGGTLLVQYNTGVGDFNSGNYAPYSLQLSRARVSVEEAPVEILAPQDSVFHSPNQITAKDFEGWIQERGLYFMSSWDSHFTPLLESHDPGESPQKGGLLRASYGKGTYVYAGYAFFRQLPAGVPGAIRLYVNLLNAGHAGQ